MDRITFLLLIIGLFFPKERIVCMERPQENCIKELKGPKVVFYPESVDALYEWFESGCPADKISSLLTIPANQFMEQLFQQNEKGTPTFKDILFGFSRQKTSFQEAYLLNEAYDNRQQLIRLKTVLSDSLSTSQAMKYVLDYFPRDFKLSSQYPVYFTLTGWQWGDAMAFSYIKKDNNYIIADKGISAIIFNLTIINSTYGDTQEQQIASFRRVLSHEIFHAVLNDYISDKKYYNPDLTESKTLFLLMNEGIAHFIADGEMIHNRYETLKEKEQDLFNLFSEKAEIIFDPNQSIEIRTSVLEEGLYGTYWKKYISLTGLFIAYHISLYGGNDLLKDCIKNGPEYFIKKYIDVCLINKDLPPLPEILKKHINIH